MALEAARAQGLKRYFTGKPCCRGHVSERYTSSLSCIECSRLKKDRSDIGPWRDLAPAHRPAPRKVTTDFSYLTDAQVTAWYARVRSIKPNSMQYKHHPLEELPILYRAPLRIKEPS